jgi:2,4-dienoyl-CoA reductase-like NADH-dependent reductase (Old Yellow Enzyme family)
VPSGPPDVPTPSALFSPLTIRGTTFDNRAWVSPMCQYSAVDGMPRDWPFAHLGSFAVGGAGLVFTEATAVTANGRISPADTGIWTDAQAESWSRIAAFVRAQGSVPGMQLAHAGRKASTQLPWLGVGYVPPADGGWDDVRAPSALAFGDYHLPTPYETSELPGVVDAFAAAAERALEAGFEVAEIHSAHGYLLHEFLSPLSNHRDDRYGGSFENRTRLLREVATAVREVWPEQQPLFVRISASDWVDRGWDIEQSVELARRLRDLGVDLIDSTSGGLSPDQQIPLGPGYQVPFAARIKHEAGILTGAVGLITEAKQAEEVIASGEADAVFLARALLRNPHWPQQAAYELGADVRWPSQYLRARL